MIESQRKKNRITKTCEGKRSEQIAIRESTRNVQKNVTENGIEKIEMGNYDSVAIAGKNKFFNNS